MFSLRDEMGHSVVVPPEELRVATRIFELDIEGLQFDLGAGAMGVDPTAGLGTATEEAPAEEDWDEIDYSETSFFVHAAENFEVVFVLDFTNSMARARIPDGRSGTDAMLNAFEQAVTSLPGADRVGVVEFHDRSVEPGVLSPLTTIRQATLQAVSEFAGSSYEPGSSRVWDSIQRAASLMTSPQDSPNVVRAIVFISDGRDTSSIQSREDARQTAAQDDIQLYALGVGDVFEESKLAEMAMSTGGMYYPTRDLDALGDQLAVLVSDLRGQYRVNYITLRREGLYRTRIRVDLPWATGTFDTPDMDVSSFYGLDTCGRIAIDPPSLDREQGEAQVFVRALHSPRNVNYFRFRLDTPKAVEVRLVPRSDGGVLEGWELSGPDPDGYFGASSSQPLEFGNFGLLFQLNLSGVTEKTLEVPITFDNSLYTAGKSFSYPEEFCVGECIPPAGRIAFRSTRDGNSEIYVMDFNGREQRNVTDNRYEDFLATWSPDGRRIAFDSDRSFNREIFVMEVDGTGEASNLTNSQADDSFPAWSPDGQRIAFYTWRDGNREVYVMNADGSDQQNLTNHPGDDWYPAWSPDGERIAFTSNRDGNREIYVMNADGTRQQNLTNHPADDWGPAWGVTP